jgi:hypothetical protein
MHVTLSSRVNDRYMPAISPALIQYLQAGLSLSPARTTPAKGAEQGDLAVFAVYMHVQLSDSELMLSTEARTAFTLNTVGNVIEVEKSAYRAIVCISSTCSTKTEQNNSQLLSTLLPSERREC